MIRNHLNDSDIDGNISAWMAHKLDEESIEHQDLYICTKCKDKVSEKNWVSKEKCCVICWMDY